MRVFVTGGTGAIGKYAVPALVDAGHEVTALVRTADKAAAIEAQGATPHQGSLFDSDALTTAFAGHAAVVNLATAIPPTKKFMSSKAWANNERVRQEGSTAVVDAALAAGVDRVVQESVCMLYPDSGAEWVDETVEPDSFPIAQGNLAAEANTQRFTDEGGTGVVLRFGWFLGPGAAHSEEFYAQAKWHVPVQMGGPGGYVPSIHLADAGTAVPAALGAPAGIYNVVDDEPLTKRAYADALAEAAGARPWLRAPGRLALLLGDRTTSLTRSVRASNAKFKAATDWAPAHVSAREAWAATAQVLDSTD